MPQAEMNAKPGNAPIVKVGQTASAKFGSDPLMKAKGSDAVRDLDAK